MQKLENPKHIIVEETTKKRLDARGIKSDSYNSIVLKLLTQNSEDNS